MKPKAWLILALTLLASAAPLRASDLPLDQNFSLRLAPPDSTQPPALTPAEPAQPTVKRPAPLTTPEGVPLPPGSRPFQFNGITFFYIPL